MIHRLWIIFLSLKEPGKDQDSNRSILSRIITDKSTKKENRNQSKNRAPKTGSKPTRKDRFYRNAS